MKSQNGNVEYLYDKYIYIIKNVWTVYALYIVGIASWLLTVYGYVLFFQVEPVYGYILGPVVILYTLYYLINYGLNFAYKKFDVAAHDTRISRYWASKTLGKAEGGVVTIQVSIYSSLYVAKTPLG